MSDQTRKLANSQTRNKIINKLLHCIELKSILWYYF